jgi:hypothetical protein
MLESATTCSHLAGGAIPDVQREQEDRPDGQGDAQDHHQLRQPCLTAGKQGSVVCKKTRNICHTFHVSSRAATAI